VIGDVLHGIAAIIPAMEAQGFGHIVNVSSVGGFVVQPSAAAYAATKLAARAISEATDQVGRAFTDTYVADWFLGPAGRALYL